MDQFVVVVDSDPLSRRQWKVCTELKPALRGGIDCSLAANGMEDVCHNVEYFPAFCHVPTNRCVYGLRDTPEKLAALETIVEESTTPPTRS